MCSVSCVVNNSVRTKTNINNVQCVVHLLKLLVSQRQEHETKSLLTKLELENNVIVHVLPSFLYDDCDDD